jgi:hypothetical protein
VTNHDGNAEFPILHEHMTLKRKNIDLSLNLFLTAALLHVLIQSNGSSSLSAVEESDGFENWKRRRRDTRVPRASLHNPLTESAWQRLFYSGIDQSLIAMTGFDHRSFRHLEDLFTPMFNRYTPWTDGRTMGIRCLKNDISAKKCGRPRILDARMNLGIVLVWTRTRGANRTLQLIFGLTGTPLAKWLYFGWRMLLRVLLHDPLARVVLPNASDVNQFKRAIIGRHPHLDDVAFSADGLKLTIESTGDEPLIENAFYNGWKCAHYVGNIFLFAPNGTIPACVINAPGSWHDSQIADYGHFYDKLELMFIAYHAKTCIDSAFSLNQHKYLIKSGAEETAQDFEEHIILEEATSMRQTAEWGMNGFQLSFPRMRDRLRWVEFGECKVIISLVVHLYNIRSRLVGINEIQNTYMPNLSPEVHTYYGRFLGVYE